MIETIKMVRLPLYLEVLSCMRYLHTHNIIILSYIKCVVCVAVVAGMIDKHSSVHEICDWLHGNGYGDSVISVVSGVFKV